MEKIKFGKDQGTAFYKELKEKVNLYFSENNIEKSGNKLMRFKIWLYFILVILFYGLVLLSSSTTMFIACYMLMGLAVLLNAFNVSHDAAHGVAVKNKTWNKLLFQLSFQLQGNNAYVWGKNHNESHHLYTNVEGSDIDVLNNPLVRMTSSQPIKWYHQYQFIYVPFLYLLYSLNWFLFREILMAFNGSSRTIDVKMPTKEIVRLVFFKLFYIGYMIVLPAYVTSVSTTTILLTFIANHFMVSLIFTGVLFI